MKRYKPYFNEDINITKTSEFRKWFGNSKVIKGGNPLIVYHGSNSSFDAFDKKKIGTHTDDGIWGKGFYFSDKLTANHYGENVKEFFLHIENPYIIKEGSSIEEVSNYLNMDSSTLQQSRGFVRPYTSFIPLFTAQIKDKKHDGIIVDRKGVSDEYIVFSPNQIKSATENNGNFSVSSNNIYEDISIPLNKGDSFLWGKWKNKSAIYDHLDKDEKGQDIIITDTGKKIPLLKIRLIQENKFGENLRFSDLMKKASISLFTLDYSKETNKLMGAPTTHTKLKGIKVNKKKDYVIFVWKTKRTPKYNNKKQPMKAVDPKDNFQMKNANFYTIEIKVLDFFKLLKTKPDNNFTNKDIEEVFNVADIQVWSSVPAYQYQGMNYHMTLFDASIYPELREPKIWNDLVSQYGKTHNEYQFLDKHTAGVVNSIKFYIPQMRQMIKKYLDK